MKFRENPVLGRKVFFIDPPFSVEKKVIEWLRDMEYEIYIIKDYAYAKPILKNCENAICFINIDNQLSLKEWFNFIKSFEFEPELKSIFLGIIASKIPETQVSKFIMNLRLPGGYVHVNPNPEDTLKQLSGILEINGAKGNRKVVRLNCDNVNTLNGYIAYGSKLYAMKVENISSIGITCALDKQLSQSLQKNTLLRNVSLSLGRWSIILQCVVISIKSFNDKIIAILFFTADTPRDVKDSIRKFIFDVHTQRIQSFIDNTMKDITDYSLPVVYAGDNVVPDYNAPTDDETADIEEVEEVEEITEADAETPAENTEAKDGADSTDANAKQESENTEASEEETAENKTEAAAEPENSTEKPSEESKE